MSNIDEEIAKIEAKMGQKRHQLKDLKAQAAKKRKKDEDRRNFIYGKAYLAGLETLSADQREKSLSRVHLHVKGEAERKFLGLPEHSTSKDDSSATFSKPNDATGDLPFTEPDPVKRSRGEE